MYLLEMNCGSGLGRRVLPSYFLLCLTSLGALLPWESHVPQWGCPYLKFSSTQGRYKTHCMFIFSLFVFKDLLLDVFGNVQTDSS